MRFRPRRLAATTIVAACLLTGCQPASTTTPTPAPSYTCTPEAGGDQFSCSAHQYDDMIAKDKLYTEAETVYRKFLAEEVAILEAGGTDSPSAVLKETTSGSFLDDVMAELTHAKETGVSVDRGAREVRSAERLVGKSKGGSVVAMGFCVDSTSVHFVRNGKSDGFGSITRDEVYFGRDGNVLKAIGADGEEVSGC